jgi:hypothetical protein
VALLRLDRHRAAEAVLGVLDITSL